MTTATIEMPTRAMMATMKAGTPGAALGAGPWYRYDVRVIELCSTPFESCVVSRTVLPAPGAQYAIE